MHTKKPTIIILSGISSSGKTTTAKALQSALAKQNNPYVHLPIDGFVGLLPPEWCNFNASEEIKQNPDGIVLNRIDDAEGPKVAIELGKVGMNLVMAYMPVIATIASYGTNVIIDGVFGTPYLGEAAKHFKDFKVYCIAVRCPLEIVEERERSRGAIGGFIGLARWYTETSDVHTHAHYDFLVDTSVLTPEKAAQQIVDFIKQEHEPQALKNLAR
ncbi:MAG: zeta toxin family protein [Candidatus Babeliales bacterium]